MSNRYRNNKSKFKGLRKTPIFLTNQLSNNKNSKIIITSPKFSKVIV